jgi:hypothetical protein
MIVPDMELVTSLRWNHGHGAARMALGDKQGQIVCDCSCVVYFFLVVVYRIFIFVTLMCFVFTLARCIF